MYPLKIRYFGIIENQNLSNFNEDLLKVLVEKEVFVLKPFKPNHFGQETLRFDTYIHYNYKIYEINPFLFDELFNIVRTLVEIETSLLLKKHNTIEYELNRYLDNTAKIEFLKEKYIKVQPKNIDFGVYCGVDTAQKTKASNTNSWRKLFEFELHNDSSDDLMSFLNWYLCYKMKYSYSGCTELDIQKILYNKIRHVKLEHEYPVMYKFIQKWYRYYIAQKSSEFILKKIEYLEAQDKKITKEQLNTHSKKSAATKLSYQVLFIDCLRKIRNEKQFLNKKIPNYFIAFVGVEINNYEERLLLFKELLFTEDFIFNKFNASDLARKISDITGSDFDRLRNISAYITKPKLNKKFTTRQKVAFENYPAETVNILGIINTIG